MGYRTLPKTQLQLPIPHLADAEAERLLGKLSRCDSVRRVVTLDIVYLPGRWFNNLLAFLDRGRHCRAKGATCRSPSVPDSP
jgi:hypothetical protein